MGAGARDVRQDNGRGSIMTEHGRSSGNGRNWTWNIQGDYTGIVVTKSYYHNGKVILRVVCPCISWDEAREYAQHDRTFIARGR